MSSGWSTNKNTSSGGHTYDRTTGTWQGETQGSFGDGNNWGAPANAPTRVIHDANGPVGVEVAGRDAFVTDQGRLIETLPAQVAPATVGPGAPGAGEVATAGPGSGAAALHLGEIEVVSSGPAASAVVSGPKGGTGKLGTGPGNPWFGPAPIKPSRKDKATGGFAGTEVHANPWFTNVEDFWEPRYGEPGEWIGGLINVGADLIYNVPGGLNKLGVNRKTPYLGADWDPALNYQEMPGLPPVEPRVRR